MSSKTHHYQKFLWHFDEKSSNNAKIGNFLAQNVHSCNDLGASKLPDFHSVARFGPEYSKKITDFGIFGQFFAKISQKYNLGFTYHPLAFTYYLGFFYHPKIVLLIV